MYFAESSEPNIAGVVGAVVPAGSRAVNFCVGCESVGSVVGALVTAIGAGVVETLLGVELEETALFVFVVAAPEFAAVTPDALAVAAVATEELAASLETCEAVGKAGSMPPFFLAPGPQIAAAITPTVAKIVAIVSGNRDFFFCSLKSLTPFKQTITQPICQFWNGVNFIDNNLNWIFHSIKMRALRGQIIFGF